MKHKTVEHRRTEILEATCAVVIERGFAGTRISDVAQQLTISASLIHYHFESKEQLLAEAFAHFARTSLDELSAQIEDAPTGIAKLNCFLADSVPEGSDDTEWMLWIDAWGEALRNPLMRRISQEMDRESTQVLVDVVDAGVSSGEFRCLDPAGAAERLSGLIDGLAVQFAAHDNVLGRERLINHLRIAAAAELGVSVETLAGSIPATPPAPVVRTVETEIRRLLIASCDAMTRNDLEVWRNQWAQDCVWTTCDGVERHGVDAAVEHWASEEAFAPRRLVTPASIHVEVEGDVRHAHARLVMDERRWNGEGLGSHRLMWCHVDLERTGDSWLVRARRDEEFPALTP